MNSVNADFAANKALEVCACAYRLNETTQNIQTNLDWIRKEIIGLTEKENVLHAPTTKHAVKKCTHVKLRCMNFCKEKRHWTE